MTHQRNNNMPTKAEVQTTKLNKMPVPGSGVDDTEFSAEQAAEVFKKNSRAQNNHKSE